MTNKPTIQDLLAKYAPDYMHAVSDHSDMEPVLEVSEEALMEDAHKNALKAALFDELVVALKVAQCWMAQGEGNDDMWQGAQNLTQLRLNQAKEIQEVCDEQKN